MSDYGVQTRKEEGNLTRRDTIITDIQLLEQAPGRPSARVTSQLAPLTVTDWTDSRQTDRQTADRQLTEPIFWRLSVDSHLTDRLTD